MPSQETVEKRLERVESAIAALEKATTKEAIAEAVRLQLTKERTARGETDYSF